MEPDFDLLLARRMVERAVLRLGLTFAETAALVDFDPDEPHVGWYREEGAAGERLRVGPDAARLDPPQLELLLRQQILHRSMYHGFGEQYADEELADLCLEVCINRLLLEGYGDAMRRLCASVYARPPWVGTGAMLASPAADLRLLPPALGELWSSIWRREADGGFAPLHPTSLYFRLVRARSSGALGACGGSCRRPRGSGRPDPRPDPRPAPRIERLVDRVARDVHQHLPRGSSLGRALSAYAVVPIALGHDDVEDFLRRIRVRRVQQQAATRILEPLVRRVRVDPYPAFPSRLGLVYQLCGVSEAFGLYWNRDVANAGARMAVAIYLDVSGSMIPHFPLVAGFVDALKEVPLRLRSFDTEVREIRAEDLAAGRIVGGGGTDFDAPVRDLLGAREAEAGVLFTDGEAALDPALGRQLRRSRKRLYVVYLLDGPRRPSPLDAWATDTLTVPTR